MMTTQVTIMNSVPSSSSSWSITNARTISTSEMQRWIMSPVLFCTCQLYGRRWMRLYSASRSDLTNRSEPIGRRLS